MAIHYVANIRHITCQSRSGKRRSPMSDIAYNSGQALTDSVTGKRHSRPHTDGTIILATDVVSADPNCPYGNRSVPSSTRREKMYNELTAMNKSIGERVYAKTEIALPNSLDDRQLIEAAEAISLSLSIHLQRPVDFSIHKKPSNGKRTANHHMHVSWPERRHQNGKWTAKSVSYYVNMDGSINYDKVYKDESGHDVRRPRISKDAPPGKEYDKDDSGNYIYQLRDSKGRRKWSMTNVEGLTTSDVEWIHAEVDRINNMILNKYNIPDRIIRNDTRVTQSLKAAGMLPLHIGYKDNKTKSTDYQAKIAHNRFSGRLRDALAHNYAKQDAVELNRQKAESAERAADSQVLHTLFDVTNAQMSENLSSHEYQHAVRDYITDELKPEEVFVKNAMQELDSRYLSPRRKVMQTALQILSAETTSAEEDIRKFETCISTPKDRAIVTLLKKNKATIKQLFSKIKSYFAVDFISKFQTSFHKRWNSFTKQQKTAYIHNHAGAEAAGFYADYLQTEQDNTPCPKHLPEHLSLPDLATMLPVVQNWKNADRIHLPPDDLSPLETIENCDSAITGNNADSIIPTGYDAYAGLKEYQVTTTELDNTAKRLNDDTPATRLDADEAYNSASANREKEKTACIAATANAKSKETGQPVEELVNYYRRYSKRFKIDAQTYAPDAYARYKQAADDAQQKWKLTSRYQKIQATKEKMQSHSTEPQNSL